MRTLAGALTLLTFTQGVCLADAGDDTLRFYLSKSKLVVLGAIATEPVGYSSERGVLNYVCEFKVSEVCKGDDAWQGKSIRITIMRFEMAKEDRDPLVKKGAECILFLNQQPAGDLPPWVTADVWFGIQHPSPLLSKSLTRLAKEAAP
jgi:hypothetical protein